MANVEDAVRYALAQRGKPYQWSKEGPNAFDCSGLMWAAFRAAGVSIGRVTYTQIRDGRAVAKAALVRGDLVFPDPGHVQMYLGDGTVIHSPHAGSFVQIVKLGSRFYAARRIIESGSVNTSKMALPMGNAGESTSGLGDAVSWLTDRHNWLRMGLIVGGGAMVLSVAGALATPAVVQSVAGG